MPTNISWARNPDGTKAATGKCLACGFDADGFKVVDAGEDIGVPCLPGQHRWPEKAATPAVEKIEARHQPAWSQFSQQTCLLDKQPWPCDATLLLAQLAAKEETLAAVGECGRRGLLHMRKNGLCVLSCRRCEFDRILKGGK